MAEVYVKGLAELQKFLDQLPAKIEQNIMRGALRAGAKVIEEKARALCPVGEPSSKGKRLYGHYRGALRDSIRIGTRSKGSFVYGLIKAGGKNKKQKADVFYAHMIEYGSRNNKPYVISSPKGLFFGGLWRRSALHPPLRAKPFMRPALDQMAMTAVIAAARYTRMRLQTTHGLEAKYIMIEGDDT